jgi:glyoxylase-like metal-dependent hydrolase (beta-lactamase superfamily II)
LWVLGNYYFNVYLVKGEQASALIETGVSGTVDEVIRQLESLRISPSFLVVTHPHADHVTGLDGLRERYSQALAIAGDGAGEFLSHPKVAETLVAEDRHMSDFLAAEGFPPGRPSVAEPPLLMNSLVANDGDQMDLGGLTLRFLSVPGHSPATIAVHVPEIRCLMTSDSLGFRYPGRGVFPLFFTSYADYLASLDLLKSCTPAILGPAHQGPITGQDVIAAFEESRSEAVRLRDTIRQDTREPEAIAADLLERYYRDELTMYTRENIMGCARLIVKRAFE